MTAEAIVMNKYGVALAADSVIASHTATSPKIFNSIEKLFELSSCGKVAIMIYEATEFMNVPWETLISDYRAKLMDKGHPTVEAYASDFLAYLKKIETSPPEQENILLSSLTAHYWNLAERMHTTLATHMRDNPSGVGGLPNWVENQLLEIEKELQAKNDLPGFENFDGKKFVAGHFRIVGRAREQGFFASFAVTPNRQINRVLLRLSALFACKDIFSSFSTGLVFAGFGDSELMPSALSYRVEAMLPGRFKCKLDLKRHVTSVNQGMIIPFAQSDMVYRFLQGVDKDYDTYVCNLFQELSREISRFLINQHVSADNKKPALQQAFDILDDRFEAIARSAQSFRMLNFADPVIEAVKNLPKRELATLAEALVHLTSLRRKMSVDIETAGEPIDVVVVSKSDGFVWIKRKMYYDRSLNLS
ncbi:MAG: hypothetical protein AAFW74_07785 [Pseudomonadota bacterium]